MTARTTTVLMVTAASAGPRRLFGHNPKPKDLPPPPRLESTMPSSDTCAPPSSGNAGSGQPARLARRFPRSRSAAIRSHFATDKLGRRTATRPRHPRPSRSPGGWSQISERPRHGRRPLRRTGNARIQSRARRSPRHLGEEHAGRRRRLARSDQHDQLRQGTPGRRPAPTNRAGPRTAAP